MYNRFVFDIKNIVYVLSLSILLENIRSSVNAGDSTSNRTMAYQIEVIQEGDVDNVMKLLKKTFFVDEPLNKAIELCRSDGEGCPELEDYCKQSLLEGLSLQAVDSEGNVVGAIISGVCPLKEEENGNDLLSQAERCKNPKFQKILYILARRERCAKLWEKFPEEENLVEVKVAATDPKWRRKGIMNALLNRTQQLVAERKIRLIRMDTSSAYSAKSADRLGFTCVHKAKYTDIMMDGLPIIVPEPPHLEDRVYVKTLF